MSCAACLYSAAHSKTRGRRACSGVCPGELHPAHLLLPPPSCLTHTHPPHSPVHSPDYHSCPPHSTHHPRPPTHSIQLCRGLNINLNMLVMMIADGRQEAGG
eukprot:7992170-Karenia_brevis.AAC.1